MSARLRQLFWTRHGFFRSSTCRASVHACSPTIRYGSVLFVFFPSVEMIDSCEPRVTFWEDLSSNERDETRSGAHFTSFPRRLLLCMHGRFCTGFLSNTVHTGLFEVELTCLCARTVPTKLPPLPYHAVRYLPAFHPRAFWLGCASLTRSCAWCARAVLSFMLFAASSCSKRTESAPQAHECWKSYYTAGVFRASFSPFLNAINKCTSKSCRK